MLTLARYTLKGPYQATLVVGLTAIVAVFAIPVLGLSPASVIVAVLTNLLAVVLVALIILTQGSAAGLKVIAIAALALSLAAWMGLQSIEPGISMALMQWLPVIVLAQVLRSTQSLALTLLVGAGLGVLIIVFQLFFGGEVESSLLAQMVQGREGEGAPNQEQAEQMIRIVRAGMLLLAAMQYLVFILVIFIARWLQARLADSPGFGQEFRALALGKPAAAVAALSVALGFYLQVGWLLSFAFVMLTAFLFQGIAVVHARLGTKKQAAGLFVLFYLLLVFAWQITGALTAITGILDNWLDFRKKPEDRSNLN